MTGATAKIRLSREGLVTPTRTVPLYAGSMHYWRHDPRNWRAALAAMKDLGVELVDTYVPWAVHEIEPGVIDLGQVDPRCDVVAFLRMIEELGMLAIVRPGPHINAELTYFGIPERIIWDPACQAQSPRHNPVMLPMVPQAFPVPSYASEAFFAETARWFQLLGPALAPLCYPDGPIVLLQIDNEGALYFRDGAYDQDYRPEAVALYRAFLERKYESEAGLRRAYADDALTFTSLAPPTEYAPSGAAELVRHLDWAEFQEHLVDSALARMRVDLEAAGLKGLPTMHNLPFGQEATPLHPGKLARTVDLVGLDYYHRASLGDLASIARRTSELAVRCDAAGVPPFACEMGAGFPPFFAVIDEADSIFTVMTALAFGLRGFNIYMAVERDRWIGAPIDDQGRPRPFARFWKSLFEALARVEFHKLRRRAPVRLVTPRTQQRLARVMHAFGPATGALFAMLGASRQEGALEELLGGTPLGAVTDQDSVLPDGGPVVEADAFLAAMEKALLARGVPFAHADGEPPSDGLDDARWILCGVAGGLEARLVGRLRALAADGKKVTLGPRAPEADGLMRPFARSFDPASFEILKSADRSFFDADTADESVARAAVELNLPVYPVTPPGLFATVHEDADHRPAVLFVMNPGRAEVVAHVSVPGGPSFTDLLTGESVRRSAEGTLLLPLGPRTVRMLAFDRA